MPGRAAGLRASPSAAAAVALPCARAQMPDAKAIENPAAIATQLTSLDAPPCANAGTANESADSTMNSLLNVRMCFSSYEIAARRWLTSSRTDALTLEAVASSQLSAVSDLSLTA